MADIGFYAGEGFEINNLSGSGIGFFGAGGAGYSVQISEYQGRSWVVDSTGTSFDAEIDNCKYISSSGVLFGQTGSGIHLLQLPNYLSTLNIRFTHGSAVKTQNAVMYISDRTHKNNDPSGVTMQCAEIIHPTLSQTLNGSGDASWVQPHGSGVTFDMVSSPGTSGFRPNGSETTDTRHDWFVAMSCSPTTTGAKEFRATLELEYL